MGLRGEGGGGGGGGPEREDVDVAVEGPGRGDVRYWVLLHGVLDIWRIREVRQWEVGLKWPRSSVF